MALGKGGMASGGDNMAKGRGYGQGEGCGKRVRGTMSRKQSVDRRTHECHWF